MVWELWNVLVQLAFTILIAYTIMKLPHKYQIAVSFGLLFLTEALYRVYNSSDPYNNGQSFGSWADMLLMSKINAGGWVTINFIPASAHTIWEIICGQVLISKKDSNQRITPFIASGLLLLVSGYSLDFLGVTPIIKRIATASFTLVSGGYAILFLTFFLDY